MVTIKPIDPTTFEPQQYSVGDEKTIPSYPINSTFTLERGRVESLIYDLNNNLLEYNPNSSYSTIENGIGGNPEYADALLVDPAKNVENLGLSIGSYNVVYNIINNELFSSFEKRFRIKEISANRKEIRLTTSFLSEVELENAIRGFFPSIPNSTHYPDFYLNFGENNLYIANNILFDNTNNQYSILVKLYNPLPSFISVGGNFNPWICTLQRETIAYRVEFEQEIIPIKNTIDVKGPNFSLDLNNQTHSSTKLTSFNGLSNISGISTGSYYELNNILEKKGIEVNIDYTNFSNFVHFSSAEQRVENFYYKMQEIQEYNTILINSHSVSNSAVSESRAELENKINSIVKNFDGFESWMYFTSSSTSIATSSFPTPWPKKGGINPPYGEGNYPLTNLIVQDWYNNALESCSLYDTQNKDNLNRAIPDYLLEDEANEPYFKFIGMIGQHFDTLFVYIQDITNRYNADNRLDFGISKDLVGEAIKSMGINLYTGNFTATDLYSSFTGINSGNSLLPPLESGQALSQITNYVTASDFATPIENVNKEIYKRIYHNLPLLLRQKGSVAGLRTLITCFGIPKNILDTKEFDIRYIATTQSAPPVEDSGSLLFFTESVSLPPSLSGYIPSEFLSPLTRVQQHFVKSESYNRSLQYTEVGYSPQGYIDKTSHAGFDPLAIGFPSFEDFYFGDNPNYYSSRFINDSISPTITQTVTWDFSSYIRYIKFFDSSLFNMIKDFTPARTSTATGVIIKPTIKERNRQRPAQITVYNNSMYSGSADTLYYDWGNEEYVYKAIGNYDARLKTGSFEYPGSTAGGWNNSNQVQFASGTVDWKNRDLATPVVGLIQYWSESVYTQMGYAQQWAQTGSKIIENANHKIIHNNQDEFYNGIFKQIGIGSLDDYLIRELAISSIFDGAGGIRTDNNRYNVYKKPTNTEFTGLNKGNFESLFEMIINPGNADTYKVVFLATTTPIIYLRYGQAGDPDLDVLMANGSSLNFTDVGSSGVNITINVGSPTTVSLGSSNYVAYSVLDGLNGIGSGTGANYNDWYNATTVTYVAPFNPSLLETQPGPWAYNDYNPLINNSFDPQAGLVNYNGIRKSVFFMDADYSPSASSSIVPINIRDLAIGSASRAPVQDSNYTSRWWTNSRYYGVRNSSPDFNKRIIRNAVNILATLSDGIGLEVSSSTPTTPSAD